MGFQINTNVSAMAAYRNLSSTQNSLTGSLEKLSSGLRINKAADDAAGLSISEGLRAQIGGLNVAARNAQDGISVVQTAEGALGEVHSNLQRLRDLAVQAGNDSNNADSRAAITTEATELVAEIARIGNSTNFNGTKLLAGGDDLTFQVGANSGSSNSISVGLSDDKFDIVALATTNLAVGTAAATLAGPDGTGAAAGTGLQFTSHESAQMSIVNLDKAITDVAGARSELGAKQNRFETAINSINISKENLSASESRIRDTDMAAEMANFTRSNILQQAGTSMLAQANSLPQSVLSLLG
ncbi:flagellin [Arenivirga flava]|uniref:Flagellin n=1 Tax=Arenivirga flava TaxID=1930060 RepID=A0AA37UIK6_9MICO|nr:flagellin [Arenivirga flava]GMA27852.1 flagellin [Arenivirga flava]